MKSTARGIFATVLFCFFLSGMAGLVYQIVWARYLAIFLGHTSYAVVAVLVAFMGGLALGNAWFGVRADRSDQPLALYAWLEIGIAVYALIFPSYYHLCHDAFIGLARHLHPGSTALLALKFAFSLLTILLPTILMGATFPVLTRFVTRSLAELREKVAALYCLNSAGAVVGCLVADFWWIQSVGLEMTVFFGAALNLAVGAVALALHQRTKSTKWPLHKAPESSQTALPEMSIERPSAPSAADLSIAPQVAVSRIDGDVLTPASSSPALPPPHAPEAFNKSELRLAIAGIGLSGFVAMLYEVAWTRLLGLVLGSSTHAFSLMLVTFITGIAIGAWIVYRWKSLRQTLNAFGWAELGLALTLFLSMFLYEYLPFWFAKLASLLARREEAYPVYQALQALICFFVMLAPTIFLGATLPLISRTATTELTQMGKSVGAVFAVNTLGTVLGTVVTGLWLMPALGLAQTFAVGIALNGLIGLAILGRRVVSLRWAIVAPLATLLFVWASGRLFDERWHATFSVGLFRTLNAPRTLESYRKLVAADTVKFYQDGAGASVAVVSRVEGGKEEIGLKVNGKADASTGFDVTTQRLLGHIPMMLRPQSREALVIGFGSGMTCGSIGRHPSIERIEAVEISPEVVTAASHFAQHNDDILKNPRLHVIIEDAKSFLKTTRRSYDVIVSEPSNPWMAGVSGVFTREYYESCRDLLKSGGVVAQWVQIYETSDQTLHTVLSTFASIFPFFSVWHPAVGDLILIGSREPLKVDLAVMESRFAEPKVKADFERFEMTRLAVFLAREIVSSQNGPFVPPGESLVHSDFYPVLEYLAQEAFFVHRTSMKWREFDENFSTRATTLLNEYLQKHPMTEADYRAFGRFYLDYRLPEPDLFRSLVLRWQAERPESTVAMELMGHASDKIVTAELEALRLAPMAGFLMDGAARDAEPLRLYESYLMQTYRAQRSIFYRPPSDHLESVLNRLLQTNPAHQRVYRLHLAEIAWDRGDDAKCLELGQQAFDPDIVRFGRITFSIDPQAPHAVLHRMGETLLRSGRLQEAWRLAQDAQRNRYTEKNALLDMTCRKIEAYVGTGAATPR